jgi:hypothetical protein
VLDHDELPHGGMSAIPGGTTTLGSHRVPCRCLSRSASGRAGPPTISARRERG